jgi:hypothetical protein
MNSILDKKEVSRARVGPRELKDPRSKDYAIQTLYSLKLLSEMLVTDQKRVARELAEIELYHHWEVLGYKSKEEMFAAELSEVGLANVSKVQSAAANTTGDILLKHVKPDRQFAYQKQSSRAKANGISPRTQRTLDRLARDFKPLHAKVISGELSCHAAAVQAGIVKVKTPLQQLLHWWLIASPAEQKQFMEAVK